MSRPKYDVDDCLANLHKRKKKILHDLFDRYGDNLRHFEYMTVVDRLIYLMNQDVEDEVKAERRENSRLSSQSEKSLK